MSKAQLAILPTQEGRKVERRIVNLAARLRESGARLADAEVLDLSIAGFMAETELALEPGMNVWLKLPGLAPQNSIVAWTKEGRAGFEFTTQMHPTTLNLFVAIGRKPIRRGHFGPQG